MLKKTCLNCRLRKNCRYTINLSTRDGCMWHQFDEVSVRLTKSLKDSKESIKSVGHYK